MTAPITATPFIPDTAPFTPEQRAWLNGFLAGLYSGNSAGASGSAGSTAPRQVTILFGSQTGTAEALSRQAARRLKAAGMEPKVVDMGDISPELLKERSPLLLITSTYGDGEPPDNARSLHAALMNGSAPRLNGLEYAVLGLGDSSYPRFCQCSKEFDARLAELGAKRLVPAVECDVDTDEPFERWIAEVEKAFGASGSPAAAGSSPEIEDGRAEAAIGQPAWSRNSPFPARLLKSVNLNKPGSSKATYHVEISLAGSGIEYEPGDALGVMPVNSSESVDEILRLSGLEGDEQVKLDGQDGLQSLREALTHRLDIRALSDAIIRAYLERVDDPELAEVAGDPKRLEDYLRGRELSDLLGRRPDAFRSAQVLTGFLKKLQPRLYSISSSPRVHPDEVHLTVGRVLYEAHGAWRRGVCSNYLGGSLKEGEPVRVYLHSNKSFRLPADDRAPVVMIGPGTGIAPFRAFLEEREARGATGKIWLFFGDQHMATDFLYADQIDAWLKSGLLTRFDTAFSRDQTEKIYVQDRMREHAEELSAWIEEGAFIYVCGDAGRMARGVDAALHEVLQSGGRSAGEAAEYVERLRKEKRYLRDVY